MSNKSKMVISTEKKCKRCGEPLASMSKYKYCENCRRKRARVKKEAGSAILAVGAIALTFVPIIGKFKKQ